MTNSLLADRAASRRKFCFGCGAMITAPLVSEHIVEGSIRHLWACEACGYACDTVDVLPFAMTDDAIAGHPSERIAA